MTEDHLDLLRKEYDRRVALTLSGSFERDLISDGHTHYLNPERTVFVHTTHPFNLENILRSGGLLPPSEIVRRGVPVVFGSKVTSSRGAHLEEGIFFYPNGHGDEAPGQYFHESVPVAFLIPQKDAIKHAYVRGFSEMGHNQIILRGKGPDGKIPAHVMELVHPDDVFYVNVKNCWLPAVPSRDPRYAFLVMDPRLQENSVTEYTLDDGTKYAVVHPNSDLIFRRHAYPYEGVHVNPEYREDVRKALSSATVHVADFLQSAASAVSEEQLGKLDQYMREVLPEVRSENAALADELHRIMQGEGSVSDHLSKYISTMPELASDLRRLDNLDERARKLLIASLLSYYHPAAPYNEKAYTLAQEYGVDEILRALSPAHRLYTAISDLNMSSRAMAYYANDRKGALQRYYTILSKLNDSRVVRDAKTHILNVLREKGVSWDDVVDAGDRLIIKNAEKYGVPRSIWFFGKNYSESLHEALYRIAKQRGYGFPDLTGFSHVFNVPVLPVFEKQLGRPAKTIRAYGGRNMQVYDVPTWAVSARVAAKFKQAPAALIDPRAGHFYQQLHRALRGDPVDLPDASLTSRAVAAAISDFARRFRDIEKKHGREAALLWASRTVSEKRNRYLRSWFRGNFRPTTAILAHVFSQADHDFAREYASRRLQRNGSTVNRLFRGFVEGHYE